MAKRTDYHQMDIEFRGDLEDISRPQSNLQRPGPPNSSAQNNSAYRLKGSNAFTASLELLSPEEITAKEFDLALEDLDSSSESSDDDTVSNINTIRTSDIFHITEPAFQHQRENSVCQSLNSDFIDEDLLAAKQLALFEDESDTEIEVGSDEEDGIIAEIKAEITNQVRGEMQEELGVYREANERLNQEKDTEDDILEGMDPKVKDAILRMRKLDKILERKIRREKAVKKDRILLQRRLRKELKGLDEGKKKSITVDEKRNMDKFLALALPPSHSMEVNKPEKEVKGCLVLVPVKAEEGVLLDDEPDCVTPVFATQVPEDVNNSSSKAWSAAQSERSTASATNASSRNEETSAASSRMTGRSKSSTDSKASRKKRKDFIKRNMELAADAANAIAMTDDEKNRIEGLLKDLEVIPEMEPISDPITSNPYQIVLSSSNGFRPSEEEIKRLDRIDDRLRALLPPEDFNSICSTPSSSSVPSEQASPLFVHPEHSQAIDFDLLGERALKNNKEHRDLQVRLSEIEKDLTAMTQAVDREMVSPCLTEEQLQELLDQCTRTMSRASAETSMLSTSRSGFTAEQPNMYDNPPKLPEHVLQELLADARKSLMSPESNSGRSSPWNNSQSLVLESVNDDTMKELLQNPRTMSRMSRESSMMSHRSERQPFLPEIDPKGIMSTQRLSDTRPRSNSGLTVHNHFGDSPDHMTPRPPSDARKSGEGRRARNSFDN